MVLEGGTKNSLVLPCHVGSWGKVFDTGFFSIGLPAFFFATDIMLSLSSHHGRTVVHWFKRAFKSSSKNRWGKVKLIFIVPLIFKMSIKYIFI